MADEDSRTYSGTEASAERVAPDLAAEIEAAVAATDEEVLSGKDAGVEKDLGDASLEGGTTAAETRGPNGAGEKRHAAEPDAKVEKGLDSSADASEKKARDEKGRFVPVVLSDAVLERAVKAGIPMAEAKQYPNEALLAATCARAEGVKTAAGSPSGAGTKEGGEAKPAVNPLDAVPDLDPLVFDPKLVEGLKALKGVVKALQAENVELRGSQAKDWLTTKLEGVKNLTKGDAVKTAALSEKFTALSAGYKAVGKAVPADAVFGEATQLVLGAEMESAKKDTKTEAAGKRSGQIISRPTGRNVEAKPDDAKEVAAMIDRKFFAKS